VKYVVTWGLFYYPPEGLDPKQSRVFDSEEEARSKFNSIKSELDVLKWVQLIEIGSEVNILAEYKNQTE